MFVLLPWKVNFSQMEIYGIYNEKTYRQNFSKHFEWIDFNIELGKHLFGGSGRKAIAIDPSYISKSRRHTQGIGRFWSGCAQQARHGLEILDIGLIDINRKDCVSLKAVQTPSPKSLAEAGVTLPKWYLVNILLDKERLMRLSKYIVADAYFATFDFAKGLTDEGFHLVSRFRSDAALMYIHEGPSDKKRGRPKKHDGKTDVRSLDMSQFKPVKPLNGQGRFFSAVAYSKSLKRKVRLVVFQPDDGKPILYFSTDVTMAAKDVAEYYQTHFQIEFCYRDGKQFARLCDCQSRSFDALDFAFNASLSAVNLSKVVINEAYPNFSLANFKSLIYKTYISLNDFLPCQAFDQTSQ